MINDTLGDAQMVVVASSLSANSRVYDLQGEDDGGIPETLVSAAGDRCRRRPWLA